jgi:uncharacterized membrane protein
MPSFGSVTWVLWNLFLAVIPVGLGYAVAAQAQRLRQRRSPALWLVNVPLLFLWFIFLPNSCYLFTEPRHLLVAVERGELWSRAPYEPLAALRLALWVTLSLFYTSAGALTFALSIRPMRALIRAWRWPTLAWAGPFFVLMSLGVYLGLVIRYNSWDLLTRPGSVFATIGETMTRPVLAAAIVLFGFVLWVAYEVIDIWVDGFAARWRAWTGRGAAGSRDDERVVVGQTAGHGK